LLGFQFGVVLEHRFNQLPTAGKLAQVAGLACLLAAFVLAVAPATFHRIAEHGNDTARALQYTSRMVGLALLPFGLALGLSLFVVSQTVATRLMAIAVALAGVLCALGLWYGWPLLRRRPGAPTREQGSSSDLDSKIEHTLTEDRMVLPGAQALLGFQFMAFFATGFVDLPRGSQLIHFGGLALVSLAGILLIAPAAFHRIAEQGQPTLRFYLYASGMVQASLIPLAMGMAADFYVVVAKVTGSGVSGAVAATALLIGAAGLWWCLPWAVRSRKI
jgi:hypothetical protein